MTDEIITTEITNVPGVKSLTVQDGNLYVQLSEERQLVSLDHFNEPLPIERSADSMKKFPLGNAGVEGEEEVMDVFANSGVNRSDIFHSHKITVSTRPYELWDGLIRYGNKLIFVQSKTRVTETDSEQQKTWIKRAVRNARTQIKKSYYTLEPYRKGKKPSLNLRSYDGRTQQIALQDYEFHYLIVLAINKLPVEVPGFFQSRTPEDMPFPGSFITLKDLRDMFLLLGADKALKYLAENCVRDKYNYGYEILNYANRLEIEKGETLVVK